MMGTIHTRGVAFAHDIKTDPRTRGAQWLSFFLPHPREDQLLRAPTARVSWSPCTGQRSPQIAPWCPLPSSTSAEGGLRWARSQP